MNDYLIMIEGVPLPISLMDRTSWRCTPYKRKILAQHDDIDGVGHVYESTHYRTEIQFAIREHSQAEHALVVQYLQKLSKVTVVYWNDLDNEYRSGLFRIDDPVFAHKKTFNNTIWYEATSIKLTEY